MLVTSGLFYVIVSSGATLALRVLSSIIEFQIRGKQGGVLNSNTLIVSLIMLRFLSILKSAGANFELSEYFQSGNR